LGVVDSTATAVDLIAVRFFSTTTSYNQGDYVVQGGKLYTAKAAVPPGLFNSIQWSLTGGNVNVGDTPPATPDVGTMWFDSAGGQLYVWYNDGNTTQWVIATNAAKTDLSGLVPLAGGTMTGPLILAADPTQALGAATKQYVDTAANTSYRNRIINGDMSVDARNGGAVIAAPASSIYVIDRWKLNTSIASKGNVGQTAMGSTGISLTGQLSYLLWTTTAAYTPAAADVLSWVQAVEGCNFNDANWGTANALPVTLEFWAFSSLTGTFAGALRDNAGTRSYTFTFAITVVNTWQKFRIPIPGDTAGASWSVAANASGLGVYFNLGVGSNRATAAGAWTAGNFLTAPGAVNVVSTLNATLYFTGVALMVGAAAANAEPDFRKYSDNLIDCQRYYQAGNNPAPIWSGNATASGAYYYNGLLNPTMRATPTITPIASGSNVGFPAGAPTIPNLGPSNFRATMICNVSGVSYFQFNWTADADF
jgi:hypothetical protein